MSVSSYVPTTRPPRRRPWQGELRGMLQVALAGLGALIEKANFAAPSDELLIAVEQLGDALTATRCWKCGCSEYDPCEGGCSWVQADPPLCSACAPGKPRTGAPKMRSADVGPGDARGKPGGDTILSYFLRTEPLVGKTSGARSPRRRKARAPAERQRPHVVPRRGRTR